MNVNAKTPLKVKTPKVKKPNAKGIVKKLFKDHGPFMFYCVAAILIAILINYIFGGDKISLLNYFFIQLLLCIFGILHVVICPKIFDWAKSYLNIKGVAFTLMLTVIIGAVFLLSPKISFLKSFAPSYVWATIIFLFPWLFMMAYEYWAGIPDKIFKKWVYPYQKEIPIIEVIEPAKVTFLISKQIHDDEYYQFELNVPVSYKLGDFMHYFIHRYNYDKNPAAPIFISKENNREELYQWLFKRKPKINTNHNVLDPDKTFKELGIKSKDKIIAERVGFIDPEKGTAVEVIENTHSVTIDESPIDQNENTNEQD